MDAWVQQALAKWPRVPALFGWLSLDRRGRWLLKGDPLLRPALVELIGRNYAADDQGRWFFQNGPQRGYVTLEYAPLVLRAQPDGSLLTHTGLPVRSLGGAWLDEHGALLLACEHGPALLADADLDWALERLGAVDETALEAALALPSGADTGLVLGGFLPVGRLDFAQAPEVLGFVRTPAPEGAEVSCEQADEERG